MKVTKKIIFFPDIVILILLFLLKPDTSTAKFFCLENQNELQTALKEAAINDEDDVLNIVLGAELGDFILPTESGHLLSLKAGYAPHCLKRLISPETRANSGLMLKRSQATSTTPQQNTTGPVPPEGIQPKTELMSSKSFAGGFDVTVLGVPGYTWRHGCGPTAVGMVIGFWDENGCDDLFEGNASSQTENVNQGIASQGHAGSPGHYEDYSLPIDHYPSRLPDKSELPSGDEHVSNSIADFMFTSWSSKNNLYGWSWSNHIAPAFSNYANYRNSSYVATTEFYPFGSTLTWDIVTNEIDAQRPMVFLVDSNGDGLTDHFVTVVGYRLEGTTRYYGCLDTWAPADTIRWVRFRGLSSDYPWGVWGGYSFQLVCANTYTDLVVQSPGVNDHTLRPGQSFTASTTVINHGNSTSSPTTVRYYSSTDSIITTEDTQLATDSVSSLSPNETSSEAATVSAPATTGIYWIGTCVDSTTNESDTENNCSIGVQIHVKKIVTIQRK